MIFTIFLIIAAWNIHDLPLWLQICITVFGSLHALFRLVEIGSNEN